MTRARDLANIIGSGATSSGTITAATLAATTGVTFPDGSIPLVDLDIDGGTDIGAALVDADLMVVDDGAGGTNRKATMSRLATYMGAKITGGSMVYLTSTGAISNAASVSFTQFDASKYDHYEFWFQNVIPATDDVPLYGLTSSDGGSSYDAGASDYRSNTVAEGTSVAYGLITSHLPDIGSAAEEMGLNFICTLNSPHTTAYTTFSPYGGSQVGSNGATYGSCDYYQGFTRRSAADVDAIQFKFSSGNIESGEIVMYGIANGT